MRSTKRPYYLLAVFILPLLFALQHDSVADPLRNGTLTILKPAFLVSESLVRSLRAVQSQWTLFWKAFDDQKQSQALIQSLQTELSRHEEATRENERLKQLLDFREAKAPKSIAARIIARDSTPWRNTVILDKGSRHGIQKDMVLVVPQGLAGRIVQVGPGTARGILLIDPDARVSALTSESRAQGVVAGDGSHRLRMIYLQMDGGAAVGETVLTSGMGSIFPKGIPIGKIISIERDTEGLHLTALIEPFVSFSKLEEVLCVVSYRAE